MATYGAESGLWCWDGRRFDLVTRPPEPIVDLAFRGDELILLADSDAYRLEGDRLVALGAPPQMWRLHVGRDALLLTDAEAIAEHGIEHRKISIDVFAQAIADRRPLWQTAALDTDRHRFTAPVPRDPRAERPIRYWFTSCVGASFDDAAFLGAWSDDVDRYAEDEGASFVGRIENGRIREITTAPATLRDLCRLPSGRLYVAAYTNGGVWRTRGRDDLSWERLDVPPMQGLFALGDECVMAFAGVGKDEQHFFLFDGQRFTQIPAPPGRAIALHGIAPDWIVAVGYHGLIARWDGRTWQRWVTPLDATLGTVHVVSQGEMYATGPCGMLLEGSERGWVERAPTLGSAVGITKRGADVLIGDPVQGLLRLEGNRLVPVSLRVWPWTVHAGQDALLVAERDRFTESRDLETVRSLGTLDLEIALRTQAPSWRERS